jgi:hypothetical protein
MYLGYACHQILRDRINEFDYFGNDCLHGGDGNDRMTMSMTACGEVLLVTRMAIQETCTSHPHHRLPTDTSGIGRMESDASSPSPPRLRP